MVEQTSNNTASALTKQERLHAERAARQVYDEWEPHESLLTLSQRMIKEIAKVIRVLREQANN